MKRYSNNKDINNKVKDLLKLGWIYRSGKKHDAIISPNGFRLSIPGTPSDRRSFSNFKRDVHHIACKGSYYAV